MTNDDPAGESEFDASPEARIRSLEEQVRRLEQNLAEEAAISDTQRRLLSFLNADEMAAFLLDVVPELTACERARLAIGSKEEGWQCWDRVLGCSTE